MFSHDPNSGSPYRIINWEEGSDTTKVTWKGGNIWIQSAKSPLKTDKKFSTIIKLLDELLNIFNKEPIDVEFAITKDKKEVLWLLQVRPLIVGFKNINNGENDLYKKLHNK